MNVPQESGTILIEPEIVHRKTRIPSLHGIRTRLSIHWKLLAVVLFCNFVLPSIWGVIAQHSTSQLLRQSYFEGEQAAHAILKGRQGSDSLAPMLVALHLLQQDSHAPVYQKIFFEEHVKFQYPLSSLLPYYALQRLGISDHQLYRLSKYVTLLSFLATIVLGMVLALRLSSAASLPRRTPGQTIAILLATGIGGLLYFPLLGSYSIGQIQIILSLGFAIAFYCWLTGRQAAAGAIMGLMVLVKPQYGLFLLWALLRKRYSAAISAFACALGGALVSCFVFGLGNNLDYIRVLRYIGARGESFSPNQSANGLLNRLLFNGPNLFFDANRFAPYNRYVYAGTLLSTLVLLAVAFFYPWGKQRRGGIADFATITLVSTLAAPVAWTHHYGILFPIFIWLWFAEYSQRHSPRYTWLLALSYALTASTILLTNILAAVPVLNILQSYLYFGALLALILLLRSRAPMPAPIPPRYPYPAP